MLVIAQIEPDILIIADKTCFELLQLNLQPAYLLKRLCLPWPVAPVHSLYSVECTVLWCSFPTLYSTGSSDRIHTMNRAVFLAIIAAPDRYHAALALSRDLSTLRFLEWPQS